MIYIKGCYDLLNDSKRFKLIIIFTKVKMYYIIIDSPFLEKYYNSRSNTSSIFRHFAKIIL